MRCLHPGRSRQAVAIGRRRHLLEAAREVGIAISYPCHLEGLSPVAPVRSPCGDQAGCKLQAACITPGAEGWWCAPTVPLWGLPPHVIELLFTRANHSPEVRGNGPLRLQDPRRGRWAWTIPACPTRFH